MPIQLEVWGERALFTRPELKSERVSYDMITPSAARGILDAIMYHPGMRWVVDEIHVCAPIRFENIRRNEVKSVISARSVRTVMERGKGGLWIDTSSDIQQRASMVLTHVHYVIDAHFVMTAQAAPGDNPGKFLEMAQRRIRKGQCYHTPYFGCREFPANFRSLEQMPSCPEELKGTKDLGYMLYDMDYSDPENIQPMFFRAVLRDGVLRVPTADSAEVKR